MTVHLCPLHSRMGVFLILKNMPYVRGGPALWVAGTLAAGPSTDCPRLEEGSSTHAHLN